MENLEMTHLKNTILETGNSENENLKMTNKKEKHIQKNVKIDKEHVGKGHV